MASCETCKKPASSQCARCNSVHYCSKECQKSDWKRHKLYCEPVRKVNEIQSSKNTNAFKEVETCIEENKLKDLLKQYLTKTVDLCKGMHYKRRVHTQA